MYSARYSCQILMYSNLNFLDRFLKKNILPVAAQFFHADGRTERQCDRQTELDSQTDRQTDRGTDVTKLIFVLFFGNFANEPKNV